MYKVDISEINNIKTLLDIMETNSFVNLTAGKKDLMILTKEALSCVIGTTAHIATRIGWDEELVTEILACMEDGESISANDTPHETKSYTGN